MDLRSIGVANASIIVDRSAPVPGNVYDGVTAGQDLMYTKDQDKVMPNIQFIYNAYIHDQQFVWYVCLFVHTFNFSPNIWIMLSGIQDEKLLLTKAMGMNCLSSSCFYQLMILSHIFHLLYFFYV